MQLTADRMLKFKNWWNSTFLCNVISKARTSLNESDSPCGMELNRSSSCIFIITGKIACLLVVSRGNRSR